MTAPVTLTTAEAGHITHARNVLRQALTAPWPDNRTAKKAIGNAVHDVQDALEKHSDLLNGTIHWEAYDPDLREYAEPYDVAIAKSAEDADEAASYLAEVIGRHCGSEGGER